MVKKVHSFKNSYVIIIVMNVFFFLNVCYIIDYNHMFKIWRTNDFVEWHGSMASVESRTDIVFYIYDKDLLYGLPVVSPGYCARLLAHPV